MFADDSPPVLMVALLVLVIKPASRVGATSRVVWSRRIEGIAAALHLSDSELVAELGVAEHGRSLLLASFFSIAAALAIMAINSDVAAAVMAFHRGFMELVAIIWYQPS